MRTADGRISVHQPERWRQLVAEFDPRSPDWFCLEASTRGGRPERPGPYDCAVCMAPGAHVCGKCRCTPYCSAACQQAHWRDCHKKACSPNPRRVSVAADPATFDGLPPDCFEFISIAPTGRCDSLADVCARVVAPADDLFDLMPNWKPHDMPMELPAAVTRRVCRRFGWTGPGGFTKDVVAGYRIRENKFVYIVTYDDCFQDAEQSPGMRVSYYGRAFAAAGTPAELVRGTMVLTKLMLVKKTIKPESVRPEAAMIFQVTDDADVAFEWLFAPLCKAEVAHLVWERLKAIEQGGFDGRMWRAEVREKELAVSAKRDPNTQYYNFDRMMESLGNGR